MNDLVHSENYKSYTIKIYPDMHEESPREWCNMGTIAHWHRRGFCGEQDVCHWDSNDIEEFIADIEKAGGIVLPIYLYEHGGQTVNTTGFSCPWDSSQVGFIYAEAKEIRNWFNCKRITKAIRKNATRELESEIKILDQYLTGQVYCFQVLNKNGDLIDSCYGFYGDYDDPFMLDEARSIIDHAIKIEERKAAEEIITAQWYANQC